MVQYQENYTPPYDKSNHPIRKLLILFGNISFVIYYVLVNPYYNMSEEENKEKIINHMGTNLLNKLNIGGIVEAAKFYSVHRAAQHYEQMTDEDKEEILKTIKEQEEPPVEEPDVEIIEPS